jgi:hypothetical protein
MQRRFNPRGLWQGTPGYGGGSGFTSPKFYGSFRLVGITKDASDVALGNCVVKLFEAATDIKIAQTTSDGSGNFSFNVGTNAGFFYYVYYKAGSPDVAGTSVNTIAADPV